MKFLIDEDLSYKLVSFLNNRGFPAVHIREIQLSLQDSEILEIAVEQEFIVLTFDKDFGELVFKEGQHHLGVIFLRLKDQTLQNTKKVLGWFLSKYSDKVTEDCFAVITEKEGKIEVRFKKR